MTTGKHKSNYKKEFKMGTILRIEGLEKYYGSKTYVTKALDNISFSVEEGEFLGIMGASGRDRKSVV